MSDEKMTRRKISFPTYKTHFFSFFFSLNPSCFQTSELSYFFIHFKQFKMLQEHRLKLHKSSLNSNTNRTAYKEFFGCSITSLCSVWWFVFLSCWPPLLWGAITFSFLIHFRQMLVCQMRQEEGLKFCLDTKNNGALPLDPACPKCLSAWSPAGLP